MKRITFHSKDFIDFPEDEDGDMLNFYLNKNHQTTLLRPYTIRSFRKK